MEIHFCDVCNESVPSPDLAEGKAVVRKGRVICAACETAMSAMGASPDGGPSAATAAAAPGVEAARAHHARRRADASAGAAVAGTMAAIALLGSVGAAVFLYERDEEREHSLRDEIRDLGRNGISERAALGEQVAALRSERSSDREALRTELAAVERRLATRESAADEDARALRDELLSIAERLAALDGLAQRIDEQSTRHGGLAAEVAGLRSDLAGLGNRVVSFENMPVAPVDAPPPEPSGPEWIGMVDLLASPNSGDRWTAVQSLGDTGDPGTAEFLTPMLKDPDIFVRMATARVLGDLRAVVGIPALIDALEDPEASVREASIVALRSMTGENFRFDPSAKESERAKRVRGWREWWKKASDELIAGGPTVP